jgi:pyruvate dehydrogenase E1 component beta subunit
MPLILRRLHRHRPFGGNPPFRQLFPSFCRHSRLSGGGSYHPYDAKGLFATALVSDDPVIFLEHKSILFHKGAVPEEEYTIPFGQARVARAGQHCTVVAVGAMVGKTLQACERLALAGIEVEVIDHAPSTRSTFRLCWLPCTRQGAC